MVQEAGLCVNSQAGCVGHEWYELFSIPVLTDYLRMEYAGLSPVSAFGS